MSASIEDQERAALMKRLAELGDLGVEWLETCTVAQLRSLVASGEAQLAEYAAMGFIDAATAP